MTDKVMTGENDDIYAALADVDLRDLSWMPVDVVRLRDSGMAAKASGEEFMAAVMLWSAAWHQVPAASLPDDDRELAKLAGYGRALNAWQAVREMALYGFERGPDGRLYHLVIAEKALEAVEWVSKKEGKKAGTRERVRRHRAKIEEEKAKAASAGTDGAEMAGKSCNADVTRYSNDPVTPCNAPNLPKQTLTESPLKPPRNGGANKRVRGKDLPEDWEPGGEGEAFARKLGLDCGETLARFRDHVAGQSGAKAKSPDWSARWREWCRGAADRKRKPDRRGVSEVDPSVIGGGRDSQWSARAAGWAGGNKFWPATWGAPPDQPGCECPPHILKSHGITPPPRH